MTGSLRGPPHPPSLASVGLPFAKALQVRGVKGDQSCVSSPPTNKEEYDYVDFGLCWLCYYRKGGGGRYRTSTSTLLIVSKQSSAETGSPRTNGTHGARTSSSRTHYTPPWALPPSKRIQHMKSQRHKCEIGKVPHKGLKYICTDRLIYFMQRLLGCCCCFFAAATAGGPEGEDD